MTQKYQKERRERELLQKAKFEKEQEKHNKISEIIKENMRVRSQEQKNQLSERLKAISEKRSTERQEREQKAKEWKQRMDDIKGREYVYKKFEEEYK